MKAFPQKNNPFLSLILMSPLKSGVGSVAKKEKKQMSSEEKEASKDCMRRRKYLPPICILSLRFIKPLFSQIRGRSSCPSQKTMYLNKDQLTGSPLLTHTFTLSRSQTHRLTLARPETRNTFLNHV